MLKGIGASEGVGIGKARKLLEKPIVYTDKAPADTAAEKERLLSAVQTFCEKNEARAARMDACGADGDILRGHIAMLSDPYMLSQMQESIETGVCAEKAVETDLAEQEKRELALENGKLSLTLEPGQIVTVMVL